MHSRQDIQQNKPYDSSLGSRHENVPIYPSYKLYGDLLNPNVATVKLQIGPISINKQECERGHPTLEKKNL